MTRAEAEFIVAHRDWYDDKTYLMAVDYKADYDRQDRNAGRLDDR